MSTDKDKLSLIAENEKEWRGYMLQEMRDMRTEITALSKNLSGLRNKFTALVVLVGTASGSLGQYLKQKFLG